MYLTSTWPLCGCAAICRSAVMHGPQRGFTNAWACTVAPSPLLTTVRCSSPPMGAGFNRCRSCCALACRSGCADTGADAASSSDAASTLTRGRILGPRARPSSALFGIVLGSLVARQRVAQVPPTGIMEALLQDLDRAIQAAARLGGDAFNLVVFEGEVFLGHAQEVT